MSFDNRDMFGDPGNSFGSNGNSFGGDMVPHNFEPPRGSKKRRRSRKKNYLPVILVVVLSAVVGLGGFFLLNWKDTEDENTAAMLSDALQNFQDEEGTQKAKDNDPASAKGAKTVAPATTVDQIAEDSGCPVHELAGNHLTSGWYFEDGRYCSEDGTLSAAPGEAALILNGEARTGEAVMRVEAHDSDVFYLEIEDFHARDCIVLGVNSQFALEAGDVRSWSDFARKYNLTCYVLCNSGPWGFAISLDGRQSWGYQDSDFYYRMPATDRNDNRFDHLTVRVLEWDNAGNVAIYFSTDANLEGTPYNVEGIAVVDMDNAIVEDGVTILSGGNGTGGGTNGGTNGGGSSIFDDDDDPYKPTYRCSKCSGDGEISCSNCNGRGYKEERQSVPNYSGSTSGSKWTTTKVNCYKCHGSGEITCTSCGGSGKK